MFLVGFTVLRPRIEPGARRLAEKTAWCMALLAVLPVVLRLLLLAHHPIPFPDVYDEFSHLLVADTLRHFRLANPAHPLPQFFETFFVLQEPTYSSIYPIGQGLALALGRMLFGLPWAGVLLSTAALSSLSYWMLRAWVPPVWALLGGLLAVAEFGPLNPWMNNYWGGALAAAAGCLVFGALPRIADGGRRWDGALLGVGLGLHLLTRPYESVFLGLSVLVYFAWKARSRRRAALVALLVMTTAVGLTLLQNRQVTGSWTTLPYQLSRQQYGVPASLTIQASAVPQRPLTPQQQMDYRMQLSFQGRPETLGSYVTRLAYRVRFLRFFFLAPLYLAVVWFVPAVRQLRFAWVLGTVLLFALGANLYPFFQVHYVAVLTSLFLLMSVVGMRRIGADGAWILALLCGFHVVFWYGMHLFDGAVISAAMRRYETWDAINHGNPERRIAVSRDLAALPGRKVVFVRYWPNHIFQEEWVFNEADIDRAKVVWARDLGSAENEKLRGLYPDAAFWLLEPDARPPKLSRYEPEPTPLVTPPPAPEVKPTPKPLLRLEDVK